MAKIYAKLAKIQRELKAPKNLWNKFGAYYYRNAEGILEAVKPMLGDMALIISDEPVMIGERFYIKATVTLTDGEESVSTVAYAREDETKKGMDGCQITGACSSYARKYALNALLMIDDSKDSDDDSLSPKNPENDPKEQQVQNNVQGEMPAGTLQEKVNRAAKGAAVNKVDKVPATAGDAEAAKKPETPGAYMQKKIAEMKAMYPNFDFIGTRKALIESGTVKDVPSATMTMEQAIQLAAAVNDVYATQLPGKK